MNKEENEEYISVRTLLLEKGNDYVNFLKRTKEKLEVGKNITKMKEEWLKNNPNTANNLLFKTHQIINAQINEIENQIKKYNNED